MEQLGLVWEEHKGKIGGVIVGLVVGLFILRHGFWRTAFVATVTAVGLWVGILVDREGWVGVAKRFSRLVQRGR